MITRKKLIKKKTQLKQESDNDRSEIIVTEGQVPCHLGASTLNTLNQTAA